jgi:hypothetical protein
VSIITLSKVAAAVDLKRVPSGLEINPARGREGCLEASHTVTRYILQELKVSPNLARVVSGQETISAFVPQTPGEEDSSTMRVLAIEDYLIYPVSPILRGWSLVHPSWIEVPADVLTQNQEQPDTLDWRIMAVYNVDLYHQQKHLIFPLYETILLGIQTCLFDRLQFEMRSLYSLYLAIEGRSTEVDSSQMVEVEYLARPALYLLNRVLPALSPNGSEIVSETFLSGHLITAETVQLEYNYMSSNWSVFYRGGKKWEAINPIAPGEDPTPQLLTRRDFLNVYYQAAAAIIARKIHEVQKKITQYKLKSG